MSESCQFDGKRDGRVLLLEPAPHADGQASLPGRPPGPDGPPRLLVRAVERTALVRFHDAEILFGDEAVRAICEQIDRLAAEGGYSRLVLNFRGVRYLSCAVLGRLAALQERFGAIQLCGLDALGRDVLRITHLERVFDVCDDEAAALGLILA